MFLKTLVLALWYLITVVETTIYMKNGEYILMFETQSDATVGSFLLREKLIFSVTMAPITATVLDQCNLLPNCRVQDGDTTISFNDTDGGFKILWESQNVETSFTDCLNLETWNWYAGPEKYRADWPIEKQIIKGDPYTTSKVDSTAISERYWLNSRGGYVYVDEKVPLFIDQNNLVPGQLCFTATAKAPYIGRERVLLNYTLRAFADPAQAHLHAVANFLGKPTGHPNENIIRKPIWTTWAKYYRDINDTTVVDFANSIANHGFSGQLEIDDMWEDCYGSTVFNNVTFANINDTVATLKSLNFTVSIWTHPFVNTNCPIAAEGLENDYFVKSTNNESVINWWNGDGYHIDFTKPEAREWYTSRLKRIQTEHGIDSFKFDAGECDWAPSLPLLTGDVELLPNKLTSDYVRTAADFGDLIEVRSGFKTQDLPILVRMIDKDSTWDNNNGLYTLITTLLQMNLAGYTLVLPDLIGGNGYQGKPSAELLARWIQANTFMPTMQFSYLPWEITSDQFDGVGIMQKCVQLHELYSDVILEAMYNSSTFGTPVNPPIWWIDPKNSNALKTDDQYLLGDRILVAPIIVENATSRDVILPRGSWRDGNNDTVYQGPRTIKEYPAPIDVLPYFVRCYDC